MDIDNHPMMQENIRLENEGCIKEANEIRDSFVAKAMDAVANGLDFCICKADCQYHGKCTECVLIHRGHQNHLPNCLKPIIRKANQSM